MNLLVWMQEQYDQFSPTEQVLADYLLKHAHQAANLDAKTILKDCSISRAALYRFCTHCKVSGLQALLLRISQDASSWTEPSESLNFSYPFDQSDSLGQVAQRLQEDSAQSVQMTHSLLDVEDLAAAAQKLRNAKRILVFTSASNLFAAYSFRFQMAEIGKTVLVPADEYEQRLLAAQIGPDDFTIVITMAARAQNASFLLRHLKTQPYPWLLISSSVLTKAKTGAAFQLLLPSAEDHAARISSFSTRASLNWLLDVLFAACYQLDYQQNRLHKAKVYDTISERTNPGSQ